MNCLGLQGAILSAVSSIKESMRAKANSTSVSVEPDTTNSDLAFAPKYQLRHDKPPETERNFDREGRPGRT